MAYMSLMIQYLPKQKLIRYFKQNGLKKVVMEFLEQCLIVM